MGMRRPGSVSVMGWLAFAAGLLWFLCQAYLNGTLFQAYLQNGQIGMMWVPFIWLGLPALLLVGMPATVCGLTAVIDARRRELSPLDRALRWVGLLMAATAPVEGIVMALLWLPYM